MKKMSYPSLLLCLLLLTQLLCAPVAATEIEPTGTEAPTAPVYTAEELGAITVSNGCRTIEAQVPLGGSDRILKSAQAAFVYEVNSNTVLYAYNPDLALSPGVLAKLVTAIVAIENGNLDDEYTVNSMSYRTLPGSAVNINAGLKEGEKITLRDLLHYMIMQWANDAAVTIAENIAGSQENFVQMMNQWVHDAGCVSTKFTNVHGISSVEARTTARDMVRIYQKACKNRTFKELLATTAYTVGPTNKDDKEENLRANNYLMEEYIMGNKYNYDGVTTGFAPYGQNYGAHIVCTAETGGMSFVIVVLGAERQFASNGWQPIYFGNYEEVWTLLDFAFDGYKLCRLLHEGQSLYQFTVANGDNQVVAQCTTAMDAVLPANAKMKNLLYKYTVKNGGLTAPIAAGQSIATLQIWYQNSCIAETELHAMSSVRAASDQHLTIGDSAGGGADLASILSFVGIVCLVIFIPWAIYLIVNNVRRAIARNRRRRRRQSRRRSR